MPAVTLTTKLRVSRETLERLWRTHEIFNARVAKLTALLHRMRQGQAGPEDLRPLYQRVGKFVLGSDAKNAHYLMNSVSIANWTPNSARAYKGVDYDTGEELSGVSWADEAAALTRKGRLLYNKKDMFQGCPGVFAVMAVGDAVAAVSSYLGLMANWRKAHTEWAEKRALWEAAHPEYMQVRPKLSEFELECGEVTGRRGRWVRWRSFLANNPDLAAWRGGAVEVVDIGGDARRAIDRARPEKRAGLEVEQFFLVNPELSALDRLHGYYQREFARAGARRRAADGFEMPPLWRRPDAHRNPRWMAIPGEQTGGYRRLRLPPRRGGEGAVELPTINEHGAVEYVSVPFYADPRFGRIRRARLEKTVRSGQRRGETTTRDGYEIYDPSQQAWVACSMRAARLVFDRDGEGRPTGAHLAFLVDWADTKPRDLVRLVKFERDKRPSLPDGLVVATVHLGLRHFAYCALAVIENGEPRLLRVRNLWTREVEPVGGRRPGFVYPGPTLERIIESQRLMRAKRSRHGGRLVRDERFARGLADRIANLKKARLRRQVRAIVDFVSNTSEDLASDGAPFPKADYVVFDSQPGLVARTDRERGLNRAIANWAHRGVVEEATRKLKGCGVRVREQSPIGASQVCSKCGALGRRYSLVRHGRSGKRRVRIEFDILGKLFACRCGYLANAEHNAAVNALTRFFSNERFAAFEQYRALGDQGKAALRTEIEAALLPVLAARHSVPTDTARTDTPSVETAARKS